MKNYYVILIALITGVVGYFVGSNYPIAKQTTTDTSPFANQRMMGGRNGQNATGATGTRTATPGNMAQRGAMMGGRPVSGEILSIDDKSMTVKLTNNTSKIVMFDAGMIVNKMATGTATDMKVGEKVAAFGKENTDGTMTAQNVQLNPQFQMGGRPTGSGAPSGTPIAK